MFKKFAATLLTVAVVVGGSTSVAAAADSSPIPSLTYSQAVSALIFEANNLDRIFKRIAGIPTCDPNEPCLEDNSPEGLQSGVAILCGKKLADASNNLALFDDVQPEVTALATAIDDACTQFDDLVTQLGLPDVNSGDWQSGATALHEALAPHIAAARAANPLPTPPTSASPTVEGSSTPAPPDTGTGESDDASSPGSIEALGTAAMLASLLAVTLGYARRRNE